MRRDPATGMLVRTCPHCGQSSPTLGSSCSACGCPFDGAERRGVLDRLPLVSADSLALAPSSALQLFGLVVAGLVNLGIIVVLGPLYAAGAALRRLRGTLRARAR